MRDHLAEPGPAVIARLVREVLDGLVVITSRQDEQIRTLLAEGMSARRVAERLGCGLSRTLAVKRGGWQ